VKEAFSMSQAQHARITVVAAVALALGVAFVWLHLATPSDDARLEPGQMVWRADGVVVTPLEPQPNGLRRGDVVVAVDGRSMDSWARGLFQPGAAHPQWRLGQTVTYTVMRAGQRLDVPVKLRPYPLGAALRTIWGTLVFGLAFELVAAFVVLRRPRDPAARVLFLASSCLLSSLTWAFGLQVGDLVTGPGFWLYAATTFGAYILFWVAFLHFSLIFPRLHPLVIWQRRITSLIYIVALGVGIASLGVLRFLAPGTLLWLGWWLPVEGLIALPCIALSIFATISTYRTSHDAAARQKIRLVVFAGLVSGTCSLILWVVPADVLGHPVISANVLGLLGLPFPLALAVAILRYRLFDIDRLINRTMVYGTLTGALAAIYFGSVIGAQAIAQALTGRPSLPPVIIVGSTLLIAALFQPLRRRIQAAIDQRFYRRKYDAAKTLAAFGATLRGEVDLDQLSARLVAVVEETMQPARVSLWLRPLHRADPLPAAPMVATTASDASLTAIAGHGDPLPSATP
jgi:two-component system NarL family sensor kinase